MVLRYRLLPKYVFLTKVRLFPKRNTCDGYLLFSIVLALLLMYMRLEAPTLG